METRAWLNRHNACRAVLTLVLGLFATSSAIADERGCFATESVEGAWTILATYGANVALAMGRRSVGEDGQFTGTFLLNAPTPGSPTGARTITTGTQVGIYQVNCDGTGSITRTLTSSTGVVTTQTDDFVITRAVIKRGVLVATEMADAVEVPSALVPGGIFVRRVHTRLPEDEERDRR